MTLPDGRGAAGRSWTLAIWIVVVGLGAGALGAALARRAGHESEKGAGSGAWRVRLAPLRARLDALEQRWEREPVRVEEAVRELEHRIAELESLVHAMALGGAPEPRSRGLASESNSEEAATPSPSPYGQAAGTVAPTASASASTIPEVVLAAARRAVIEEQRRVEQEREERESLMRAERAKRRVDALSERLQLTETQREAFASLLFARDEARRNAWRAVRRGELDPEDARAQVEQARTEYEERLKSLLSPTQYAELEAVRKEREARWRGRRGTPTQ